MGRDTYMVSRASIGDDGDLELAACLREADKWCRERGLEMVPLNTSSAQNPMAVGVSARAKLVFRAVPRGDREDNRPNFEREPDHHQMITIRHR